MARNKFENVIAFMEVCTVSDDVWMLSISFSSSIMGGTSLQKEAPSLPQSVYGNPEEFIANPVSALLKNFISLTFTIRSSCPYVEVEIVAEFSNERSIPIPLLLWYLTVH